MRILVMGAGLQGSACAYDLLESEGVERVVVADLSVEGLPPFLEARRGDARLEQLALDARDEDAVRRALEGVDVCLNALPYFFNPAITRLAVEAGVHYADLGGNTEIVFDQLKLDDEAREKGISVVPDCGLAPGMVNILAVAGMAELDETDSVKIRVGGLPQEPEPPLNYHIVYSLQGVLDYYSTDSWVLRDGRPQEVGALSEIEHVDFPEPVGRLEAFHTAGGISTLPWSYEGKVRSIEYKTLRYPGHAQIMKAIRALGLLELDPVEVDGVQVVPRDAFIASAEPRLKKPGARDLVALRVEAEGTKGGARRRVVFDLLDRYDEDTQITAMERTTGFSLSIIGQLAARGELARRGVATPDEMVPARRYIDELARRGIRIERRVE
ncbi:MAG TPA: saccharopine dehydrogenase C-terminal domain-containing protein [Longimicrobiales bacterium]|nr:saccharopine dehydrogenase C-terminal domain-containing protein [Longimicrobiales bacterium]